MFNYRIVKLGAQFWAELFRLERDGTQVPFAVVSVQDVRMFTTLCLLANRGFEVANSERTRTDLDKWSEIQLNEMRRLLGRSVEAQLPEAAPKQMPFEPPTSESEEDDWGDFSFPQGFRTPKLVAWIATDNAVSAALREQSQAIVNMVAKRESSPWIAERQPDSALGMPTFAVGTALAIANAYLHITDELLDWDLDQAMHVLEVLDAMPSDVGEEEIDEENGERFMPVQSVRRVSPEELAEIRAQVSPAVRDEREEPSVPPAQIRSSKRKRSRRSKRRGGDNAAS